MSKQKKTPSKPVHKIPVSPLETRCGPDGRATVLMDTPTFKNEEEEANWWDEHQDLVEDLLIKYGRRVPPSRPVTIRLPVSTIERARKLAESRGIPYQSLIKLVLHEGLKREEARPDRLRKS